MSHSILYDLAAFKLANDKLVLAGLRGDDHTRARGVLARQWKTLAVGDMPELMQFACNMATDTLEKRLDIKHTSPEPEQLVGLVRKKLEKAVPVGEAYPHANKVSITGFCMRVERDAMPLWKAEDPARAAAFLALKPVERSPYQSIVLETRFKATQAEAAIWFDLRTPAKFMDAFALFKGAGEY